MGAPSGLPNINPVRISYTTLQNDPTSLYKSLAQAFGSDPGCLGIILVDTLPPGYITSRERLFVLSHAFANLPEAVREGLSRPEAMYSFGWSHGKEVMNGRPDTMKGSYYANPLSDVPNVSDELRSEHPEYYSGNVWPADVPGMGDYESTFKALGKVVYDVGLALARACEPFVASAISSRTKSLESLIAGSQCNKARLLHYFPEEPTSSEPSSSSSSRVANDALCGTHVDHSLLTGLCSAMYLAPSTSATSQPSPVPAPSKTAGLYIYPRHDPSQPRPEVIKVQIPPDCLAFQTGEALELLTAGRLAATLHFVSGNAGPTPEASGVSRETFAFFLQPDVDDLICENGETFGRFTKRVLGRHYGEKAVREAEN